MRGRLLVAWTTPMVASALWADEGGLPVDKPTTITQPGHYILTRDVVAVIGSALDVGTIGHVTIDHVTIDLNGLDASTLDVTSPVVDLLPAIQSARR